MAQHVWKPNQPLSSMGTAVGHTALGKGAEAVAGPGKVGSAKPPLLPCH